MKKVRKRLIRSIPIYLMMLPGVLYLFCNNYLPMFGIVIAFKKVNWQVGLWKSPWAGMENFRFLFQSKDAFVMLRNTILYNVVFIVLGTVCAIAVAILLNEVSKKLFRSMYQSLILLPYLMSWVVVSYLAFAMLGNETGFFNTMLKSLHLSPVLWYQEVKYWPFILVFVNLWKSIGFNMIIYYSGIVGISQEYYEAARLDGAGKWKQITNITLPLLKPTVITLFIMSVGNIMASDFGLFYQIPKNQGLLYPATQTIDTYVYNALMKLGNISMSSAASVLQSVVGFALVLSANAIVRKYEKDSALF
ncbi:MAG: sugar ABC transporter permease [Roseburia sp.]|jgi:putative aldouronate transport system permease protein|nr:sugar ABC transporter permease [Roseburia sp.]